MVTRLGRQWPRLQVPSPRPTMRPRRVNTAVTTIMDPVLGACSLRSDEDVSASSSLVRKMTFLTRNSPVEDDDRRILISEPTAHMRESMISSSQLDTTWLHSIVNLMSISPGPVLVT